METRTVTGGDGVELRVEERGPADGRPVVLVHGYSQSRHCWRKQRELRAEFRLVAFDNRGHGESEKPREGYADSRLWAEDVRAVVERLDERPVLVGWSYGGLVLADYLAIHGDDEIAGVNLVSAVTEKGTEDAARFAGEQFLALFDGLESRDAEESVASLEAFVDLCVEGDLPPEERYLMLGYNAVTPPYVREALQDRTVVHEDLLEGLSVPVLVTHGEEDPVVLPAAAEKHADRISTAEASFYSGVGHSPFWEAPERFNRELRAFVRDC